MVKFIEFMKTIADRNLISSLDLKNDWEVVVIGAGIAGCVAAMLLARRGFSVLLVEAKRFPRDKVCGCCLNQRGLNVLDRCDLLPRVEQLGGQSLRQLQLCLREEHFRWAMPEMLATSRKSLDQCLANAATESGAVFMQGTKAVVEPKRLGERSLDSKSRSVILKCDDGHQANVSAQLVVVADGLTQSSLSMLDEFSATVSQRSYIGVQRMLSLAELDGTIQARLREGVLTMALTTSGYAGVALVDEGRVDIAAAIDPKSLTKSFRPGDSVSKIFDECGLLMNCNSGENEWLATPMLTRSSTRCGSESILVLGDSLGYVEPFTGEGMSWALSSAEEIVPFAVAAISHWSSDILTNWERTLRRKVFRNQWMCKATTGLIRYPKSAGWVARTCNRLPRLRSQAMKWASGV